MNKSKMVGASVLIACRNESEHIPAFTKMLEQLVYPKFEILIGDDDSTDDSKELLDEWAKDKAHIKVIAIRQNENHLKAKANVLAQLADIAQYNTFLITDVDMQLPPHWISAMTKDLKGGLGIINGFTVPKGKGLFSKMQSIDWLINLAQIHMLAQLNIGTTCMGNNMLITREAYESVGGYRGIPFSVTEDYELYKAVRNKGWQTKQLSSRSILGRTAPMPNWKKLNQQRSRWLQGALDHSLLIIGPAVLFNALFIIGLICSIFHLKLGIILASIHIIFTFLVGSLYISKLKLFSLIPYLILYEFYNSTILIFSILQRFKTKDIVWKGRSFKSK